MVAPGTAKLSPSGPGLTACPMSVKPGSASCARPEPTQSEMPKISPASSSHRTSNRDGRGGVLNDWGKYLTGARALRKTGKTRSGSSFEGYETNLNDLRGPGFTAPASASGPMS